MLYSLLATLVMLVHFGFVIFVVLGGLVVLRWRWVMWLHLPVAVYGAVIEFLEYVCPLTPLENYLRRRAGQQGYTGGFVEHYLLSILYPDGLTKRIQIVLGLAVIAVNVTIYWFVIRKARVG